MSDVGPEFAQHIETNIDSETISDMSACRNQAVFVAGMINVAQCGITHAFQPLGIVKHTCSVLAVGYEQMSGCVKKAFAGAAFPQAIVPGIFGE